jgi:predicted flap endonuclease-1-like 5' DNA nuclease
MGLLDKLKSLLGSGSDRSSPAGSDGPDVTVEHEPSAASERAIKGTDAEATRSEAGDGTTTAESGDADDATAGTDESEPETAAKADADADAFETAADADAGTDATAESPPVEEIKGIGPTYSERLGEAGIETVADLAAADAETVAEAAKSSVSRAEDWIERARDGA